MNPSLKLYFYSSILTNNNNNNNILFKIYCENSIYYFLFFILFLFFYSLIFFSHHTCIPMYFHLLLFFSTFRLFQNLPLFHFPALSPSFSLWGPTSLFSQSIPNFRFHSIPAHFLENHHSFNHFSITFKTFQIARIHSSLIYNSHFITS